MKVTSFFRTATALAVLIALAAATAVIVAPSAWSAVSTGYPSWVQASVLLGSGFNAGVGFRPWERFSLSLNLDILNDQGSASASALMYLPGEVPILTRAYVGAGATWELERRAVHPSLTAGAEYRLLFAEYEWVIAPDSYGKLRSGLRITF